MSSTGQKLKAARESAGITQEAAAERMRLTVWTLSRHENDKTAPPLSRLREYADLYGIDARELL